MMNEKKLIGKYSLLGYYITSVVGVGILVVPAIAAKIAGPASLLAWIILIFLSYPFAIVFAYSAIEFKSSKGITALIEQSFGKTIGQISLILLTATMVIGNPVMGIATTRYLFGVLNMPLGKELYVYSLLFMVLSVIFNVLGLKASNLIQNVSLIVLVTGIMMVILLAFPHVSLENMSPFLPNGIVSVGYATVLCFFSFLGWENVTSIAEDVENPEVNFRKVIPWAVLIVGVLYVLFDLTYLLLQKSAVVTDLTVLSSMLDVIGNQNISLFGNIVAVILLIISTNAWVLGASRLMSTFLGNIMKQEKMANYRTKRGVPLYALVVLTVGYSLVIGCLYVFNVNEQTLINIANSNFIIIYIFCFIAGMKHFSSPFLKGCSLVSLIVSIIFLPFFNTGLLVTLGIVVVSGYLIRLKEKRAIEM